MKEESYIRNVKYFLEELIRGCGIIQKENPAVQFTKDAKAGLYRAKEVQQEEGVGIGLYLVREILQKEGGFIKVNSEVGKGSTFLCYLPR